MPESSGHVCHSIIIPLFNERENITALYQQLRNTMERLGDSFEIVFVDDGSTDGSASVLTDIALEDGRVTIIKLSRNFGKSAALAAGFDMALGDNIITMDGDLQHAPEDIPRFVAKLDEGYDIVCGRRNEHAGISPLESFSNHVANWLAAKICGVNISDFGSGFKAYKRELVAKLPVYGELQRLIPILALRRGCKISEVTIEVAPRKNGTSKYGLRQKLPFLFDLVTVRFLSAYLSSPMHFFGTAGIGSIFVGGIIGMWLLALNLIYHTNVLQEHGPLMFFSTVLILGGVQLFALGLLAELQLRLNHDRARGLMTDFTVSAGRRFSHRDDERLQP